VIQDYFSSSGVELPFELIYPVEYLSLSYSTIDDHGEPITVSGAIFIPMGKNDLSLLSIQHGTKTLSANVASVSPENSTEGMIGLMTASMGFLTLVPDYPGFGISEGRHPYMHANSLVPCVIDFMKAGEQLIRDRGLQQDGKIFLTGYSEGGYVSLAVQKTIEESYVGEIALTAVAPLSGPYDLKGTVDSIFLTQDYPSSAYGAYFISAYDEIYGWNRLSDFFAEPYNTTVRDLFDGSHAWGSVEQALPPAIPDLFKAEFIERYNNGDEPGLQAALAENTQLDWAPVAPIHFFHGDADRIVPLENAYTAMERLTAGGAKHVELTVIPDGTHESAGPDAVFGALAWFRTF
jgi:pimeloyl-ACP methyl ester carboxylesterase